MNAVTVAVRCSRGLNSRGDQLELELRSAVSIDAECGLPRDLTRVNARLAVYFAVKRACRPLVAPPGALNS